MQKSRRALAVIGTVALLIGLASVPPVSAQDRPSTQAMVAQGQLLRVDTSAKTLAIKNTQGVEMQFRYTDETSVIGADRGVAGLATMSGTNVSIHYTKQQQDNVATQIEVQRKS